MTTTTSPLQNFLAEVTSVLEAQKAGTVSDGEVKNAVYDLMKGYVSSGDQEYQKYVRFCDLGYSRTHIVKNEHFELIVSLSCPFKC